MTDEQRQRILDLMDKHDREDEEPASLTGCFGCVFMLALAMLAFVVCGAVVGFVWWLVKLGFGIFN